MICSNWRENYGVDLNFVCVKKAYLIVRQLQKNNGKKSASKNSKMREKQIMCP